jgi:hypothetical protein
MDKVIFSISKTGGNLFVLEDKVGKKTYKFSDFSEIIDVFSSTDHPKIPAHCRVVMPTSQENRINIHQRVTKDQKKGVPKYFWSQSSNTFDEFEKVSVREVLKHIKQNVKGW